MADRKAVLACALEKDYASHVRGTKHGLKCHDCGADIVVAPSGQRLLAAHPEMQTICVDCLQKELERDRAAGKPVELGAAPGAMDEYMEEMAWRMKKMREN